MNFRNAKSIAFGLALTTSFVFLGLSPTVATTHAKATQDKTYDPNLTITYPNWRAVLKDSVLETGRSDRSKPPSIKANAGSRMNRVNKKPTRLEGNRVLFNRFGKNNYKFFATIKNSLAGLPNEMALSNFHPDEQLAFWLNLHNMAVFESVVQKYPVKILERHMKKFFNTKTVTVDSKRMSINDIETLVIKQFKNPMVIYGFFTGAIGGPNLRSTPFTAKTVWADLEDNGKDFVNSLRGVQFKGNTANISTFYERTKLAFPNFSADMISHLKSLADDDIKHQLNQATKVKANIKDWYIADLYGGGIGYDSAALITPELFRDSEKAGSSTLAIKNLPEHVRRFLSHISVRNKNRNMKTTKVTIKEVN
jgi:hypothetical protein